MTAELRNVLNFIRTASKDYNLTNRNADRNGV